MANPMPVLNRIAREKNQVLEDVRREAPEEDAEKLEIQNILHRLVAEREVIEGNLKDARKLRIKKPVIERLLHIRNSVELVRRRFRLQKPSTPQEFEVDLMWISQKGTVED